MAKGELNTIKQANKHISKPTSFLFLSLTLLTFIIDLLTFTNDSCVHIQIYTGQSKEHRQQFMIQVQSTQNNLNVRNAFESAKIENDGKKLLLLRNQNKILK